MTEDKKDFKRVRSTITKSIKEIDNIRIRLDEVYAFLDKIEFRLNADDPCEDYDEY